MNMHMGSDICGAAVRATGRTKDGADKLRVGLVGRKEALMTAIVTAETVRQILSSEDPKTGVFHSEQVIALEPVVTALKAELPDLVVAL